MFSWYCYFNNVFRRYELGFEFETLSQGFICKKFFCLRLIINYLNKSGKAGGSGKKRMAIPQGIAIPASPIQTGYFLLIVRQSARGIGGVVLFKLGFQLFDFFTDRFHFLVHRPEFLFDQFIIVLIYSRISNSGRP